MKTKNEDWTLFLIICLIAIAIFTSCSAPKQATTPESKTPVLYSRTWNVEDGKEMLVSPWTIEVEGTFEKDTIIFIDEITGYVEFAYTNQILSTEIGDPDL